eukprot:6194599-Pleurochrysis_carterae.AAC.2
MRTREGKRARRGGVGADEPAPALTQRGTRARGRPRVLDEKRCPPPPAASDRPDHAPACDRAPAQVTSRKHSCRRRGQSRPPLPCGRAKCGAQGARPDRQRRWWREKPRKAGSPRAPSATGREALRAP